MFSRFESPERPVKLLLRSVLPRKIPNETCCEISSQNRLIHHLMA